MAVRRTRRSKSLAAQTARLGIAAPQVIAHRVGRMVMAGASPSARDRAEFQLMGAEKVAAVSEAWTAMATQALVEQQKMALSLMRSAWSPGLLGAATLNILGKGMAPISRRAVANARRLRRKRRTP